MRKLSTWCENKELTRLAINTVIRNGKGIAGSYSGDTDVAQAWLVLERLRENRSTAIVFNTKPWHRSEPLVTVKVVRIWPADVVLLKGLLTKWNGWH